MNKRRRGCWLAVFSLFSIKMYSVPAYPHKVLYKFGDSTEVSIRLKGDEYNKWALTTDNYTLLPSGNEWYFAKADSMGNVVRSCVLWWTKLKRRGYRTEIGLLKNEEGMRQSLENVVPW